MVLTYRADLPNLPPMARKLRVQYAGAIYQAINRGDRREDIFAGRRVFAQGMEARRLENASEEFAHMEQGRCQGDDDFRRELLAQVSQPPSAIHYGEAIQEAAEIRAERLLAEALARMGWSEIDLPGRRKGDPGKVRLALLLRANTTMPLAWIANRFQIGARGYLTWLFQQQRNNKSATTDRII